MRIDFELDDDLLAEAMECTGHTTERATIEEGLRTLIRLRAQTGIRKLAGKVHWDGDLEEMRTDKKRDFGPLGWPD